MKIVAIIVVLILLAVAGILLFSPKAPQDVQQLQVEDVTDENTQEEGIEAEGLIEITEFSFVGYGPGKSHTGDFKNYQVRNVRVNEQGVPVAGELIIDVNSITTDTELLTQHLKEKEEFFDVAKHPSITFALVNATETGEGIYQVNGDLTVKDVTKRVGFAVNGKSDMTFSSEFRLKMSDFGFLAPGIVDDEVLVKFAGKIN